MTLAGAEDKVPKEVKRDRRRTRILKWVGDQQDDSRS
jgi:hypothetical protein